MSERSLMLGTTIHGRYRIDRLLGTGGMGAVYEAEHLGTGRRVALKVLLQGEIAEDPVMLARFQREARAAGAIQTQHITQVLDTGIEPEGNLPYLVMEYLDGEDVRRLLGRHGAIYPDLALRIVAQACLGLQKAHEANIIHRDIKPANLFLARRDGGERVVKILDFGIAKRLDEGARVEDGELTSTGTMLGSPIYMSPEQAQASKDVDHRADIWSLGVVLYQALTGRTPFQHVSGFGALIVAICRQPTPPVRDFAPWVSPELADIVHRALQQDPAERFSGAAAMFDAIRPHLRTGHGITEEMLVPFDAAPTDRPPRGPGARVEGLALGAIIAKFYKGDRGAAGAAASEGQETPSQEPPPPEPPRPPALSEPERLTVPLPPPKTEPLPPPKTEPLLPPPSPQPPMELLPPLRLVPSAQPQTEPLLQLPQLLPQAEPSSPQPSSAQPSEPEPQMLPLQTEPSPAQSQSQPELLQPQPPPASAEPLGRFRFNRLHAVGALVLAAGIGVGLYGVVSQSHPADPAASSDVAASAVEAAPSAAQAAPPAATVVTPAVLDDTRLGGVSALVALAERYPNDPAVQRALMLAALDKGDHAKALQGARRAYALAPEATADDVHRVLIRVVNGPPGTAVVALDALGSTMGSFGLDTLYEVTIDPNMGNYPKDYASKLLDKPEVRKNATAALALALDLKSAGPCARKALFPRAGAEGDRRALAYLKVLLPTRGCTKKRIKFDCYECLGSRADLKKAIDAIEARASKR